MTATAIRQFADAALGLVFPNVCQICGRARATRPEGFVCAQCWRQVRFIRRPFCERCGLPSEGAITTPFECANCRDMDLQFSFARSAVVARGMVLEIIHRYKYRQALWFEEFLADLLLRQAVPELRGRDWDFIVPVPLHPAKEREREFNQSERLADRLGAALNLPVDKRLLRRAVATRTQTLLTRAQRADNMRNAFVLRNPRPLKGRRIILLDDVLTTGATTSACARVLRRSGAAEVCVWTVARGL